MSVVFSFFIKQKTADELRISDWSSDVCSSDLSSTARCLFRRASFRWEEERRPARKEWEAHQLRPRSPGTPCPRESFPASRRSSARRCRLQIGRAPYRERTGQDVSISVVAVSFKKKQTPNIVADQAKINK